MIFKFFEMHLYIRLWSPNFYVSHSGLSEKLGSSSWIEPHKAFRNSHCNSQHIAENCLTYKDLSSIYNRIICPLRQSAQANSEKEKKKVFFHIHCKLLCSWHIYHHGFSQTACLPHIVQPHKLNVFLWLCGPLTRWHGGDYTAQQTPPVHPLSQTENSQAFIIIIIIIIHLHFQKGAMKHLFLCQNVDNLQNNPTVHMMHTSCFSW